MPEVILYHTHHGPHYSDAQLAPIAKLLQPAPVIVLSADDSPEAVVAAFANGVRGYIPTASTPIELALQIIRLVRAGGTFVPPSGLSPLRSDKGLTSQVTIDRRFTPRQMAVLDHLTLGKANKIIAYELSMSESTVKVHIRNRMKKMNASNRTEVACRARAFVDAQVDSL
jgi:DNA-binding NarL/FixJ family response regulator